jgi:2-dehydro-3-deoxy-D-arabinonate dehydratase
MHVYKTGRGILAVKDNKAYPVKGDWDEVINRDGLHDYLQQQVKESTAINESEWKRIVDNDVHAPIGNQEIWAAGVTYLRSRDARMEESKDKGGADCYQRVYDADRPELFFKAAAHRVAAPNTDVFIRKDSTWNVPEPELTLFISSSGKIQGYTVGNDMSSRSIEGDNPLYLPQAKMYERSAAIGPCIYVPGAPIDASTKITLDIKRGGKEVFNGSVAIDRMKRQLPELADWLFKECTFRYGAFLMTGTGLVPADDFTLQPGDLVSITIENIGTLVNTVAVQ